MRQRAVCKNGRYFCRARILHGQDPQRHPEKFTPQVNLLAYKWPTNEEAEEVFHRSKKPKKIELESTPAAVGASSSTPITEDETAGAAASSSYAGPAVPLQL